MPTKYKSCALSLFAFLLTRCTYPTEGLDSLISHLGFGLGIVDQEEINHFFDLEDGDGHASDDVWVERGHVVSHCHVGDDFFECLFLAGVVPVLLIRVEL